MDEMTTREKMALRILAVMFKIVAPNQEHSFKNAEMIDYIFGKAK